MSGIKVHKGYELRICNGVLWINTAEGSLLRVTGLPKELECLVESEEGTVSESLNGT